MQQPRRSPRYVRYVVEHALSLFGYVGFGHNFRPRSSPIETPALRFAGHVLNARLVEMVLAWLTYGVAGWVALTVPVARMGNALNGRAMSPSLAAPPGVPPAPIITIFSLDTCKPCQKAKGIFDKLGLPYTDISISQFPERRDDAFALVPPGVTSMPQIFFGEHRVGGASDLAALILEAGGKNFHALYDAAQPTIDFRKRPAIGASSSLSTVSAAIGGAPQISVSPSPPPPRRMAVAPAPTYADYLASKSSAAGAVLTKASPFDSSHGPRTQHEFDI